jgi:hypothetical protein
MVVDMAPHYTYEAINRLMDGLAPSDDPDTREFTWVGPDQRLAISRDPQHRIEVSIFGPELLASRHTVRGCLQYETWHDDSGRVVGCNRFALSPEPHYDEVAALICTELYANGVLRDAQLALTQTEPLIELALRRAEAGSAALLGMVGELWFLDAVMGRVPERASSVLDAWVGYKPTTRDFQFGDVGVEVKTTTSSASTHHINGWYQIEVGSSTDGRAEAALYLLSLGLRWGQPGEEGTTLPQLVERMVTRTGSTDAVERLVANIANYGGGVDGGYDHTKDSKLPRFARPFVVHFVRMYDVTDPSIRVPRRLDFSAFDHLDPDSVRFRVNLPLQTVSAENPVAGIESVLNRLVSDGAL